MTNITQFKTRSQKASEELTRQYDELIKQQAEEKVRRSLENMAKLCRGELK